MSISIAYHNECSKLNPFLLLLAICIDEAVVASMHVLKAVHLLIL